MSEPQATNILARIGERMTRDALVRSGVIKREFKNGAVVTMCASAGEMQMRIVRRGLAPQNDFSKDGSARRKAWDREIDTFREAFAVPETAARADGTRAMFYFAELVWALEPAR